MPDCFPAKNRAARSLEMPEPPTHPSAGQASPLLSTLPPSPQPLSHPLWAAVLPAGQNRLLIRWGQLAALHNTWSQVQVQVTSTSTSPVSVQVVSWQLFTILGSKYKCCLSDSQLIKGGFPPKDFGQCWNFEYLGKVGIEKSNKKPIKKTTQKIAKKSMANFFCKKNPGQRQQIENQQKQFNLHDIWSLTNLANIYGTTKICNL